MTRCGLRTLRSANEHPHDSIVPGPRFSTTTSACSTNRRNASRPASLVMSMAALRRLRVIPANNAVVRIPDGSKTCACSGVS